ncbi:MAG: 2-amino-4-hydroxy-6-hydroxymethyldihydropteridine diphosphokinase [Cyclobacteriaceae bacterium]|nr:2-amino-4-hydroxy-6-hydroxymethyldihydropteridine diphosphokinase [Flammeovirgaceae bacterium]
MKIHAYYLLLGSNLLTPNYQLQKARQFLQEVGSIDMTSNIYQTSAWGLKEQDDFLNQVVLLQSKSAPLELLKQLQSIEERMGRKRELKWGPRIIDIDILYADDEQIQTSELVIPHPEIQNRRFALVPLCEIAPEFVHPVLKKTNVQLLELCNDSLAVSRYILDTST